MVIDNTTILVLYWCRDLKNNTIHNLELSQLRIKVEVIIYLFTFNLGIINRVYILTFGNFIPPTILFRPI